LDVHPERDQKWFDDECKTCHQREIAQEYCCDFQASGKYLSPSNLIQFYEQTYIKEPVEKRWIGNDLWIWEYPDYTNNILFRLTIARGDGTDFSTFHVICVETCTQVAEFRSRISTRDFGNSLVQWQQNINNALTCFENSNIGGT